ncbi:MAG: hypothetical protein Mars2KO_27250 [Maribacter sp.]|uniref:hypothetical protein n=1 Tax=Maribacter sp. 2307UL18-2 TaxID=3386274 RepID=UPI0039BC68AE
MKTLFNKTRLIALFAVSLFAVSCSVKGELEDLAEELENETQNAKTEQVEAN